MTSDWTLAAAVSAGLHTGDLPPRLACKCSPWRVLPFPHRCVPASTRGLSRRLNGESRRWIRWVPLSAT